MIGVLDYGLGNVSAFVNLYRRSGIPVQVITKPEQITKASKLILPGVGAFDTAMTRLNQSRLRDSLEKAVLVRKVPILAVCVGMQILSERSEEGVLEGLGWIEGSVAKLSSCDNPKAKYRIPHLGWNSIKIVRASPVFTELNSARFYFLHSYEFMARRSEDVLALTKYTTEFASVVRRSNILGVQFHPEKSHIHGVKLLENFWLEDF